MGTAAEPSRPTGLMEARSHVQDLFEPRAAIYWSDMLISAGFGWAAFALALTSGFGGGLFWAFTGLAVLALYRAVLFIHELTHLSKGALPGFSTIWGLVVGVPLLVPAFLYVGVHGDHHRRTIYGTSKDPEYLPLAVGSRWKIFLFLAETAVVPPLFLIRFLVLAPIGWLVPPFHRWLERHASSLVINPAYVRRDLSSDERRRMIAWELVAAAVWWGGIGAWLRWQGPSHVLWVWYLVSFGIALVNQVRTLGAHRYRNAGGELDVVGQLSDSVTVPGGPWTELWAPVGLRYHALHHYLPDMPYHALGQAHRRLLRLLPADAPYRAAVAPSLWSVLRDVWSRPAGTNAG